jgi:hypothetical protein
MVGWRLQTYGNSPLALGVCFHDFSGAMTFVPAPVRRSS